MGTEEANGAAGEGEAPAQAAPAESAPAAPAGPTAGSPPPDGTSEPAEVPPPDGIDAPAVERWFAAHAGEVEPPLRFERIAGGRSNLTYAVADAAGRRWVLRRPPLGRRLASAHDMAREHRIIAALAGTDVPVPPLVGLCEDESVTGAPFYVMGFVEGPVLRQRADAELFPDPAERRRIGERVVETLAAIHAVDVDAVGLGELGRREDYVGRLLRRWRGQWEKSKSREIPLIESVGDRLAARIPEQGPATIVHGDYRLDNMILTPGGEIAAVVDWELCTLGDPLADLGMLVVYWGAEDDELRPLLEPATVAPGFPSRDEVPELYARLTGRDVGELDYYVALGLWKLAIILEGVYARTAAGGYGQSEAADEGLRRLAAVVEQLAAAADEAERRLPRPAG